MSRRDAVIVCILDVIVSVLSVTSFVQNTCQAQAAPPASQPWKPDRADIERKKEALKLFNESIAKLESINPRTRAQEDRLNSQKLLASILSNSIGVEEGFLEMKETMKSLDRMIPVLMEATKLMAENMERQAQKGAAAKGPATRPASVKPSPRKPATPSEDARAYIKRMREEMRGKESDPKAAEFLKDLEVFEKLVESGEKLEQAGRMLEGAMKGVKKITDTAMGMPVPGINTPTRPAK